LITQPLGFEKDRVLLANVDVARTRVEPDERIAFFHRVTRQVAVVPGVAQAAASITTPFSAAIFDLISAPGRPPTFSFTVDGKLSPYATYANFITPNWFSTYGLALRAGRNFDERDTATSPPVIIVNSAFSRKYLAGKDPIGMTIAFERGTGPVTKTIVGVVEDSAYVRMREESPPIEYAPLAQFDFGPPSPNFTISVRPTIGSPALLRKSVDAALLRADRDLTFTFRTLADQADAWVQQERLLASVSGFFSVLGLLLAALGIYGVTSYTVSQRQSELSIRMALGATPINVIRLVLERVWLFVASGVAIGVGVSLWLSNVVVSLLYDLKPRDPATFIGAVTVLILVATFAGWLPARRASRIDPADVLRTS
jgi:predicted permease